METSLFWSVSLKEKRSIFISFPGVIIQILYTKNHSCCAKFTFCFFVRLYKIVIGWQDRAGTLHLILRVADSAENDRMLLTLIFKAQGKRSLRYGDCLAIAMRIAGMSPADQTASRKLTQAFLLITGLTWQGTEWRKRSYTWTRLRQFSGTHGRQRGWT